ncbi:toxin-antitoxin system HicB family antitoxin [Bartonella taylorii]|uniref:toxin-antitoxin system HicB family antitoxin n=1 Tax=Bartonella taylorii TaxID=33046 RepID=UPI001FEFE06A|nr:toxin-antitoxin system HicB family antitoxin [Bartonella taylorii]
MNNNHYTYRILWLQKDEEYVELCAKFPSLSWSAAQAEKTSKGIVNLVLEVVKDMQHKEEVPTPFSHAKYSDNFQ